MLRNKGADFWVEAVGGIEKKAEILWYGVMAIQVVVDDRQAGLARVFSLGGLFELHLITQKNDIFG